MFPIKYLILIPLLCLLVLVEHSFLPHLTFFGAKFDLIFITVFLVNFSSKPKNYFGLFAGFFGGSLLDFFSPLPFAVFTLTLGILAFLIQKLSLLFQKPILLSLLVILFVSFLFYKLPVFFLTFTLNLPAIFFEFLYNFVVALVIFLIYRHFNNY